VWYYEFPHENRLLGRWIGIANRIGQALCFWIIPESGVPIARTTVQAVPKEEFTTDIFCDPLEQIDRTITEKLSDPELITTFHLYCKDENGELINDDDILIESDACHPDMEDVEMESYDEMLLTEPMLIKDVELT